MTAPVIAESGAIIEYLATTYGGGRLLPRTGSPARLRCTYWLHYAEGSAMPPLLLKPLFRKMQPTTTPFFCQTHRQGHRAQGARVVYRSPAETAARLSRGRAGQERMVCRCRLQRRRHPNAFSAGSVCCARRPRCRRAPATTRVAAAGQRAAGLAAGAGTRRRLPAGLS